MLIYRVAVHRAWPPIHLCEAIYMAEAKGQGNLVFGLDIGTRSIVGLGIHMDKETFEYDKDGVTVDSVLKIYDESIGRDLRINDEYILTYTNNDRVGTAQVMITGVGNYSGAISLPFAIVE